MIFTALSTLGKEESDYLLWLEREYADRMYAYAYRILRNEQDAFDAVSETFMKMVKFIDKVENTPKGREKKSESCHDRFAHHCAKHGDLTIQ